MGVTCLLSKLELIFDIDNGGCAMLDCCTQPPQRGCAVPRATTLAASLRRVVSLWLHPKFKSTSSCNGLDLDGYSMEPSN